MTLIPVTNDVTNIATGGEIVGNSGNESVTVSTGDEVFVHADASLTANGAIVDVNDLTSFDFAMQGDGFANDTAFRMDVDTNSGITNFGYSLSIGNDATVTATTALGFFGILSTATGLLNSGSHMDFFNAGTINSTDGRGFEFQSIAIVNAVNTGIVTAGGAGTFLFENVAEARLANSGTIVNARVGVNFSPDPTDAAVGFNSQVSDAVFANSGNINSFELAIFSDAQAEDFSNTGTITGDVIMSLNAAGLFTNAGDLIGDLETRNGDDRVINTGLIEGDVDMGQNFDLLTNLGTIVGDIDLGAGDDTLDARGGTIIGNVDGGAGDDVYFVDDSDLMITDNTAAGGFDLVNSSVSFVLSNGLEALTLTGSTDINGAGNNDANFLIGNVGANLLQGRGGSDIISGEAGDDTIGGGVGDDNLEAGEGNDFAQGASGNDTLNGGSGDDTLRGGSGNDRILGGEDNDNIAGGLGNDTLLGEDGDDMMFGQGGADAFNGGEGEDYIHGGAGGDTLSGANGDDTLVGGGGSDQLTGGNGADVFEFQSFAQSRATGGQFDIITDFQIGSDLIDLTALVEGTINFGGTGAASANGEAELLLRTPGGGPNTVVFVDVNGDGTQDFRINITGVTGLSETDFLL
ncbi:calcium-binding protein [uncultured Tateyamaria sp.]|uniref:calcium-binding protein n=1 Tax=uncultured Tateyamaria sp. TaxID=455651 RepID=UPI0026310F31|nr:calcium-binding protein [uncultured Tateyamaria sp.]